MADVNVIASRASIEDANRALAAAYSKLAGPPGSVDSRTHAPVCEATGLAPPAAPCDQLPVAMLCVALPPWPVTREWELIRIPLCAQHLAENQYRFGAFHELDWGEDG